MDEIKDMVPKEFGEGADMELIMRELKSVNKIALLKEDGFVIRRIMTGHTKVSIIEELKKRHPGETFNLQDINDFIKLYRDVLYQEKTDIEKSYVRRLIKSQEGLSNRLIELADRAQSFVDKCEKDDDNANAIAALRTSADIFMKMGKLQGLFSEKPDVTVNMQMDRVVNKFNERNSEFKNELRDILERQEKEIEVEGEVVDDGDRKESNV